MCTIYQPLSVAVAVTIPPYQKEFVFPKQTQKAQHIKVFVETFVLLRRSHTLLSARRR